MRVMAVLCMLGLFGAARAGDDLAKDIDPIASDVAGYLRGAGMNAVFVDQIKADRKLKSSGGVGLANAMKKALEAQGIRVGKTGSKLSLTGNYFSSEDDKPELGFELRLVDNRDKTVKEFKSRIKYDVNVATLSGGTAKIASDDSPMKRRRQLKLSLDADPTVSIRKTRIQSSPDSKYAVEIWVKSGGSDYAPRDINDSEGQAFVRIDKEEIYGVQIINDSDKNAAVTLTVDGINIFSFSENKDYTYFIVGPNSRTLIKGWHINNQQSDSFKVTEYAKSAAAELNHQASKDIGMITAVFKAAWPEGDRIPDDEGGGRTAIDQLATGKGPRVDSAFKVVEMHVGMLRDTISCRYSKGAEVEEREK